MRLSCLAILFACTLAGPAIAALPAADAGCLPLTATNADGNYIIPGARADVAYRRVDGQELRLDYWVPPGRTPRSSGRAATGVRPADPGVIVIHGGGFTSGSRVAFVGQFLEMLTAAGYPWVSIEYRLGRSPRVADAVDDVAAAVAFIRCHAGELGVDPDRLVLLGEDAGAALAARAAARRSPGVMGAILVGGLYDGLPRATGRPAPGRSAVVPGRQAPVQSTFLVVHGTDDTEAPLAQAEGWCGQAREDGAACDVVRVDGGSHRPENWWPVQWGYKARVVSWLNALAPVEPPSAAPPPRIDGTTTVAPGLHKRIPYAPPQDAAPASGAQAASPDAQPSIPRTLDAWLPRDRSRPAPAVILLHGGGWEAGDRVTYIAPLFAPLAAAGVAWFSVDYRLTPAVRHPGQLDDLRAAISFIRGHARAFGIDPRRIVLVGESASAQMVMWLAAEDRALAGVASFYGVYDFVSMVTDASPRSLAARLFGRTVLDGATRQVLREYSPLERAVRGMPPVLLIHGTNESLWAQGVRMAGRLQALGVDHDLVRLEGAPHGLENWEGHPEWQFYKARLVSWITRRVTTAPVRR